MGNTHTHFGIYKLSQSHSDEPDYVGTGSYKSRKGARTECEEILRRRGGTGSFVESVESSTRATPCGYNNSQSYLNDLSSSNIGGSRQMSSSLRQYYSRISARANYGHPNSTASVDRYNTKNYTSTVPRYYDDYQLKYSSLNSDSRDDRPLFGGGTNNDYSRARSQNYETTSNCSSGNGNTSYYNNDYNSYSSRFTNGSQQNENYAYNFSYLNNPYAQYIGGGASYYDCGPTVYSQEPRKNTVENSTKKCIDDDNSNKKTSNTQENIAKPKENEKVPTGISKGPDNPPSQITKDPYKSSDQGTPDLNNRSTDEPKQPVILTDDRTNIQENAKPLGEIPYKQENIAKPKEDTIIPYPISTFPDKSTPENVSHNSTKDSDQGIPNISRSPDTLTRDEPKMPVILAEDKPMIVPENDNKKVETPTKETKILNPEEEANVPSLVPPAPITETSGTPSDNIPLPLPIKKDWPTNSDTGIPSLMKETLPTITTENESKNETPISIGKDVHNAGIPDLKDDAIPVPNDFPSTFPKDETQKHSGDVKEMKDPENIKPNEENILPPQENVPSRIPAYPDQISTSPDLKLIPNPAIPSESKVPSPDIFPVDDSNKIHADGDTIVDETPKPPVNISRTPDSDIPSDGPSVPQNETPEITSDAVPPPISIMKDSPSNSKIEIPSINTDTVLNIPTEPEPTIEGIPIEEKPVEVPNSIPPYRPPTILERPKIKYNITTGEMITVSEKRIKPVTIESGNQFSSPPSVTNTDSKTDYVHPPEIPSQKTELKMGTPSVIKSDKSKGPEHGLPTSVAMPNKSRWAIPLFSSKEEPPELKKGTVEPRTSVPKSDIQTNKSKTGVPISGVPKINKSTPNLKKGTPNLPPSVAKSTTQTYNGIPMAEIPNRYAPELKKGTPSRQTLPTRNTKPTPTTNANTKISKPSGKPIRQDISKNNNVKPPTPIKTYKPPMAASSRPNLTRVNDANTLKKNKVNVVMPKTVQKRISDYFPPKLVKKPNGSPARKTQANTNGSGKPLPKKEPEKKKGIPERKPVMPIPQKKKLSTPEYIPPPQTYDKRRSSSPEYTHEKKRSSTPEYNQEKKRSSTPEYKNEKKRSSSPEYVPPTGHDPYYAPEFSNMTGEPITKDISGSPEILQQKKRSSTPEYIQEVKRFSIPEYTEEKRRISSPESAEERRRTSSPDHKQGKLKAIALPVYKPPPTHKPYHIIPKGSNVTGDPNKNIKKDQKSVMSPNLQKFGTVPYHYDVEYTPILHRKKPKVHNHNKPGHPNHSLEFTPYVSEPTRLEGAMELAFIDGEYGIIEWESYSIVHTEENGNPTETPEKEKPGKHEPPKLSVPSHIVPHIDHPPADIGIPELEKLLIPNLSVTQLKSEFDEYLEEYAKSITIARTLALASLRPKQYNPIIHASNGNPSISSSINPNISNIPQLSSIYESSSEGYPGGFINESGSSSIRSNDVPSSSNFVPTLPVMQEGVAEGCDFDVYSVQPESVDNSVAFEEALSSVEHRKEIVHENIQNANSDSTIISSQDLCYPEKKKSVTELSLGSVIILEKTESILDCVSQQDENIQSLIAEYQDMDKYIDTVLHRSMNYEDYGEGDDTSQSMSQQSMISSVGEISSDFDLDVGNLGKDVLSTDVLSEYIFSNEDSECSIPEISVIPIEEHEVFADESQPEGMKLKVVKSTLDGFNSEEEEMETSTPKKAVEKKYSFTETAYNFLVGVTSEYLLPLTTHFLNLDGNSKHEGNQNDNNISDEYEEIHDENGRSTVIFTKGNLQKPLVSVLKKSSIYKPETIPKPSHTRNVHFGIPITTTKIIIEDTKDEAEDIEEDGDEEEDMEIGPATVYFRRIDDFQHPSLTSINDLEPKDSS